MKKIIIVLLTMLLLTGCFHTVNQKDRQKNSKSVVYNTTDILEKHYTKSKRSYAELDLKLPKLSGDYRGINKINTYYNKNKYTYFYDHLGIELLERAETYYIERRKDTGEIIINGKNQNYWQKAHYEFVSQYDCYISIKGTLNGGQGGVSWLAQEGDVFNLNTGEKVKLADLFSVSEEDYMDTLYKRLDTILKKETDLAGDNWKATNFMYVMEAKEEERKKLILSFDKNNFYLSSEGLVIMYQKTLSPQLSTFTIPYIELLDILNKDIKKAISWQ